MNAPLRALVVEDSEDDALLIVRELRRGGYKPTFERVDTPAAMSAALARQTWDVVIADYALPRFSGLAALKLLQESGLDLPFILVSGAIGEDIAVTAMRAGAHDYLMKDNLTRLVPAVERELREAEGRLARKRAEQLLGALNQAALAMENALTPAEIFTAVGEVLKKLGFSCMVLPVDESRSRLFTSYVNYEAKTLRAAEKLVGLKQKDFSFPIENVDLYREVVRERKTVFVENTKDVMRQVVPGPVKKFAGQLMRMLKTPKSIAAPLIVGDEVIGMLSVQSDDLTANDTPAITAFAHQMAAAWRKAQLFEQVQTRSRYLETLQRINATLRSTLPLGKVLETIARGAGKALGYVGSLILLPDAGGERLVLGAVWGGRFVDAAVRLTGLEVGSFSLPLAARSNPMAQAYLNNELLSWTGKPKWIVAGVEPTIPPKLAPLIERAMGARLAVCVPLPVGEKVVGVLVVFSPREQLPDEERAMLLGLADQAGLAIENAQLYEQAQQEIAERKRAEEQVKASLREKEVLLKEIHHRVKNNLQVISSLLYLQSARIPDQQTREMFQESQNRVRSMALVHEKLYQSPDLARIDFAGYIRSLTSYLSRSYSAISPVITFEINVEGVFLSVDTAIPCGLIINELVSNALEHAFPGGQAGRIRIALREDHDHRLILTLGDNGVGFPQHIDFRHTASLGLELVNNLVQQLDGTIELYRDGGTEFKITFADPLHTHKD